MKKNLTRALTALLLVAVIAVSMTACSGEKYP